MQKKDDYYEIDLLHLIKVLWERVWLILLSAILAGGIAFGYSFFLIEPQYKSSAQFYVNNSSFSVGSTEFSISSSQLSAAQSLVDTYIVILKSRTTLEEVIDKAGLPYSYERLEGMINASSVNNTEIFRVSVTSTDPKESAYIANTICAVLPKAISNVVDGSDVRIVDYAVVSTGRVSPSYTKNTAIGIIIGGLVSVMAIILADLLDDKIREINYLKQNYDIPVLAVIPSLHEHDSKKYGYRSSYYKHSYGNDYDHSYEHSYKQDNDNAEQQSEKEEE